MSNPSWEGLIHPGIGGGIMGAFEPVDVNPQRGPPFFGPRRSAAEEPLPIRWKRMEKDGFERAVES